jgi:MFS transporter, PAT family, beta-lactamase induction signal transducer AmpG
VKLNKKLLLVSLLYFAEGFPFGLIHGTFPVYFRIHEMSLMHVGLLSLLGLPYALKFLWAPAVDFLGKRRQWISAAQFLMAAFMVLILPMDPEHPDFLLWACIFSLAIMSATQDVAVDAYTIEMLKPSEMGMANGMRMAAYRVAMLISGYWFVTLGGRIGWRATFLIAAVILATCSVVSLKLPPVEVKRPRFSLTSVAGPVKDLLMRPGVTQVALFILFYKLGDLALGPMVPIFWVDRGLNTYQIGMITGTLGMLATIGGGLAGGLFMARFGIFHGLWFLGIWQAGAHLSYGWVAAYPESGNWGIYAASITESFCAGLGTAAFLAFLMSVCKKEYSATQYALLSALFRVPGIVFGALSGWAATHMGYSQYFILTFFLCLPAFAFLFHARDWIPTDQDVPNSRKNNVAPPKRDSPTVERTAQAVVVPLPQAKAS